MDFEIVLVGHAAYAQGIASVLAFVGGIDEHVTSFALDETTQTAVLETQLRTHLSTHANALIICDLAGGSPHQSAVQVVQNLHQPNHVVVAGLNMALVMDFVYKVNYMKVRTVHELVDYMSVKVKTMGTLTHVYANQ